MKKLILLLASLAMLAIPVTSQAQRRGKVAPNKYKKALFAELGTPSMGISFNYDMRFTKGQVNGIGGQIGLGFFSAGDVLVVSAPIGINYLFGTRNSFFEVGGILTLFGKSQEEYSSRYDYYYGNSYQGSIKKVKYVSGYGAGLSPVFGWRYQLPEEASSLLLA
ncbi:hypothetical protein [Porphyromonas gingivicanis]|uniref:hypothetical protein n=1 Tax=Porphyromonas gingivicanis TaxID=266762 RepID=UPI000471D133|nr:hypothetical protein [Porphyromonas gingivicanis]